MFISPTKIRNVHIFIKIHFQQELLKCIIMMLYF